jgi:hypothetical protein
LRGGLPLSETASDFGVFALASSGIGQLPPASSTKRQISQEQVLATVDQPRLTQAVEAIERIADRDDALAAHERDGTIARAQVEALAKRVAVLEGILLAQQERGGSPR